MLTVRGMERRLGECFMFIRAGQRNDKEKCLPTKKISKARGKGACERRGHGFATTSV